MERSPLYGKGAVLPSWDEDPRLVVLKIRWPFLVARINKQKREFQQLRVQLSPQERLIFPEALTVGPRMSFLLLTVEMPELRSLGGETVEES